MDNRKLIRLAIVLAVILLVLIVAAFAAARHRAKPPAPVAESPAVAAAPTASPAETPEAEPDPTPEAEPAPAANAKVQQAFDDFLAAQGGTWDLCFVSLTDGSEAAAQSGHTAESRSVAASVIKLYVMGAVYDAIAHGALTHDAVYNDLYSMITVSDNSACNRLVTLLGGGDAAAGMQKVNAFAASIGCGDTQMNRLMLQPGTENFVTARDCAAILRLIYQGKCVSADASQEMLKLLRAQTVSDRIPANLPQGTAVAHKTGNLVNLSCGDVGIVFTPNGDYILCMLSNYSQNDGQTTAAMAMLSRTVYDIVTA